MQSSMRRIEAQVYNDARIVRPRFYGFSQLFSLFPLHYRPLRRMEDRDRDRDRNKRFRRVKCGHVRGNLLVDLFWWV